MNELSVQYARTFLRTDPNEWFIPVILHICPVVTRVDTTFVNHHGVKAILVLMKAVLLVHVVDARVDVCDRRFER